MGYNRSIRMAINKGFGAAPEASSTKNINPHGKQDL